MHRNLRPVLAADTQDVSVCTRYDDVMMTSQFTYLWGLTHVSGCGQQVGGASRRLAARTEGCREHKVRLSAVLEIGLRSPARNLERGVRMKSHVSYGAHVNCQRKGQLYTCLCTCWFVPVASTRLMAQAWVSCGGGREDTIN